LIFDSTEILKITDMTVTAQIYLDKRQSKRTIEGLCPVKLEVTFNRTQKYYSLRSKLRPEWRALDIDTFNKAMQKGDYANKKPTKHYKDIHLKLKKLENEANKIIEDMPVFSFEKFRQKFFNTSGNWNNVFEAFEDYINELKESKRFGYAVSFESTKAALKNYSNKKHLSFIDIDPRFLYGFENYLLTNGKSESTVGVYTRSLRRLFNLAIKRHGIKVEYPFGAAENGLYSPPKGQGTKKALSAEEVKKLASYEAPKGTDTDFYKDLFFFSLLGNGMNLADILRLQYKNIISGTIVFIREKTKRKNKGEKISVEITDQMQKIIDKWGNEKFSKDVYIFSVLNSNQTPEEQYNRIRQLTKSMNKQLKKIAREVGITTNISTYTARHSYATLQKNYGVSVAYLKEALGHSDVSVTENYLKDLEESERRKIANNLENQIFGNNLKIS